MGKKKYSLKTRMLFMVTTLILTVFLLILGGFDLVISNYIETNATEVLTQSRENQPEPNRSPDGKRKPPQTPAGSAERLFVTKGLKVLLPDFYPTLNETSPLYDFIQSIEAGKIDLSSQSILKLETEQGLYYYTVLPSAASAEQYQVSFINMANLYRFQQDLSRLLLWIMSAALVLSLVATYFIASRIAGPVKTLNLFARKIGEGEYETLEAEFHDRELHELKTSMNESSQKLKAYDQEQRVFFQNASHELRTPLQIIKTNAEAMEIDLIPKEQAIPVIKQEVDSLGELVEDIIVLSRLDARSRELVSTCGDLRETFAYTVERFTSLLAEKNLRIDYDFQTDPVLFTYDEKSMERALQNLVANAARYARTGLRVSLHEMEDRIVLKVTDDGPGISKADLPRIFDRFYKGTKGNHGIGLSIVKSIITTYGGRIEVSTNPSGTTFTIFLPKSVQTPDTKPI